MVRSLNKPSKRSKSPFRQLPHHIIDTSHLLIDSSSFLYNDFIAFIGRENVLEVAVALIIGTAFTAVSKSLVSDILTPPIALIPFLDRNLVNKFLVLRCGSGHTHLMAEPLSEQVGECHYNTLEQAANDGAITFSYGRFLESSLQFLSSALTLYIIIKMIQLFWGKQIVKESVKCGYCGKSIGKGARRCGFCTSWLDGREEVQVPGTQSSDDEESVSAAIVERRGRREIEFAGITETLMTDQKSGTFSRSKTFVV